MLRSAAPLNRHRQESTTLLTNYNANHFMAISDAKSYPCAIAAAANTAATITRHSLD